MQGVCNPFRRKDLPLFHKLAVFLQRLTAGMKDRLPIERVMKQGQSRGSLSLIVKFFIFPRPICGKIYVPH